MILGPSTPRISLALPLVTTGAAIVVAPRVHVGETGGLVCAAAIAVVPAVASLALASRAAPNVRWSAVLAVVSLVSLSAIFAHGLTAPWLLPLQNVALVVLGHAAGDAIGTRIQHPGHVLPAMVVAAAADAASVLHPAGPTHAIAGSERALGALALAVPVPGTQGLSFVLGAGDLVFAALLLGVAARHGIGTWRVAGLVLAGAALAIGVASWIGAVVPALVPIGLVTVAFVPRFRRLAPKDRATAVAAMILAVAVVAGLLLRTRLG